MAGGKGGNTALNPAQTSNATGGAGGTGPNGGVGGNGGTAYDRVANANTDGAGGGGGGAGGGAGGLGGAGTIRSGGAGGVGGANGTTGTPTGGRGGDGFTSGGTGNGGGGGGEGGYGLVIAADYANANAVQGGRGGDGGAGGFAGGGGDGGVGLYASQALRLTNSGLIKGGNGGLGGAPISPNPSSGPAGSGGVGVSGGGLAVINSAAILGGLGNNGNGARADAIDFTGGTNSLTSNTGASYTGAISIASSATLTLNQTDAVGGTAGFNYANAFTGAGAISVNTTVDRAVILSVANTYTGTTTVTAGILNVQNATALGTTAAGTTVASGAALQLQGGIAVGAEALQLSGTGTGNGGALDSISGVNSYAGAITLAAGSRINVDADTLTLSGGVSASPTGAPLALGGAGNGTVSGAIAASVGSLMKDGAGTWTLSGANAYTGATTITAGTLALSGVGTIATSSGVNASGGTFDISSVTTGTSITTLSGSASGLLNLGTKALTLTAAAGTFSGAITGTAASSLTLQAGTEILNHANTGFAGTVNLIAGTLELANIQGAGTGAITFASGAQTLRLDAAGTLANTIASFATEDTIDLRAINFAGAQLSVNGTTVTVTETTGGADVNVLTVNAAPAGFQYTLVDDGAGFAAIKLTAIPPAPSGPTAVSDTASAAFGTALIKAAPGVLINDSGSGGALTVTAVNGQTATVGKAAPGTYGSLTLNGDGSYAYTPDATKTVFTNSVLDHFTYTDTANGQTATANLDITVSAPPASTLALFGTVVTNSASQTSSVYALYEGLLGRAPDALGLEGFSASLQAGAKLTDIAAAILGSAERGGLVSDPTAYVQALYTNTLHRAPDSAGQQFYVNELNSGISQATVAVQFASSAEAAQVNAPAFSTGVFVTDAIDAGVARLYYGILGRTPDAGGLQAFEAQVKQLAASGGVAGAVQGLAGVANAMLGSSEYGQAHAGQTSAAFVDSLYVGALGRHADASGAAFFTNELAQGVSQAQVALQIAQSQEAQVHLVGQIELGWHLI